MKNSNQMNDETRTSHLSKLVDEMTPFTRNIPCYEEREVIPDFAFQSKLFASMLLGSFVLLVVTGVHGSLNQGVVSPWLLTVSLALFLAGFVRGSALLYSSSDGGKMTRFTAWAQFALSAYQRNIVAGNIDRRHLFNIAMVQHKERVANKVVELQPVIDAYNEESSKDEVHISNLGYVKLRRIKN